VSGALAKSSIGKKAKQEVKQDNTPVVETPRVEAEVEEQPKSKKVVKATTKKKATKEPKDVK